MRLRKDKVVRIKGALQTTQDPNVPKITPVFLLISHQQRHRVKEERARVDT